MDVNCDIFVFLLRSHTCLYINDGRKPSKTIIYINCSTDKGFSAWLICSNVVCMHICIENLLGALLNKNGIEKQAGIFLYVRIYHIADFYRQKSILIPLLCIRWLRSRLILNATCRWLEYDESSNCVKWTFPTIWLPARLIGFIHSNAYMPGL